MKERPIIICTELIPKVLDDSKTQTRRVIKPQPNKPEGIAHDWEWKPAGMLCYDDYFRSHAPNYCPYGQVGSGLWVRETFCPLQNPYKPKAKPHIHYKADYPDDTLVWHPSIHMPRWASRITLEITAIRVERLQEITWEDALKEGIEPPQLPYLPQEVVESYRRNLVNLFQRLWDSLNAKRGYPWDSNPFVWVIEFKRI